MNAENILAENRDLLDQLESMEHENYEVTGYLRQKIEGRDEQIAELCARIEEVRSLLQLFVICLISSLGKRFLTSCSILLAVGSTSKC